jgi:nitrite reductase (NADH) large subunit
VAGVSAAEAARKQAPEAEVILFSAESHLPYYRINLSHYLAGEVSKDRLPIHSAKWYKEKNIDWRGGVMVDALDAAARSVSGSFGREQADAIVLAMGAQAFRPPIEGVQQDGIMTIRTLDDADTVLAWAQAGREILCIGGGILGIEAAAAIARQGASVTLIEALDWLMPRQLNRKASDKLADFIRKRSIQFQAAFRTRAITRSNGRFTLQAEDGRSVSGDHIVITAGIRPSLGLAKQAGLETKNGILVDSQLRTSAPGIYAAGDVAEFQGVVGGLWTIAQYQGAMAGANAAGAAQTYGGIPRSTTLKVLGVDLMSIGVFEPHSTSDMVIESEYDHSYERFLFQHNRLAGVILLGDSSIGLAAKKAIEEQRDLTNLVSSRPTAEEVRKVLGEL